MNRTLIFFLTWFSLTGLQAQIRISGRILDVETKEPLAFAQIRALNSQLGTISNEDGYYTLSLRNTRNDTFAVSHIGYEYFRIPISQISTPDQFDVLLSERIVELDEVVIVPVEAEDLIKQALESIEDNYSHKPMNMQGFYRELISQNDTFIEFNEAIVDIYKLPNGVEKTTGNQIRLVKGRSLSEENKYENLQLNMGGGGPNAVVSSPVVGETIGEHFLDKKAMKSYEFTLDGVTSYNDRDVYIISFDQDKKLRQKLYQGTIYLDVKTLAFVSINFKLSERGKKFRLGKVIGMKGRMAMALVKAFGFDFDYSEETGRQDFVYHRGQWYLNYHRHDVHGIIYIPEKAYGGYEDGSFQMSTGSNKEDKKSKEKEKGKEKEKHAIRITALYEMAITQMEPDRAEKFPSSEQLDKNKTLPEQAGEYDEAFWENYNFVKPTDSLEKIADDMKGRSKSE
ncbi:MAG: carboxypeptidase-like regulatory domain-containing protein [Bacteroidetes bacterium]|nr:carboxypeptidase-like regulatory domain-containing protein [Bacteroidota bacterium]MCB0843661.1 carboxypeptidase-like regulatory domain-containing protein [Bacteroidota bacterium]